MGRVGQIAGLLLLATGAGLAAWGAPYYMLDWGGTFVMAGIALASAGLSCALLGTVLVKLAALRADISALRAFSALAGLNHDNPIAASPLSLEHPPIVPTAASPSSVEANQPAGGLSAGGLAGSMAGVAVAGAAVGGLAVAAKSILTSVDINDPVPADADIGASVDADVGASVEAGVEPDLGSVAPMADDIDHPPHKVAALTANDRASLDDLLAKLSLPVSTDDRDDAPGQSGANAVDETPAATPASNTDDLYAAIDDAARSLQAEATALDHDQSIAEVQVTMEQRIDDEFADLRAELATKPSRLRNTEGELAPDISPALDEEAFRDRDMPMEQQSGAVNDSRSEEEETADHNVDGAAAPNQSAEWAADDEVGMDEAERDEVASGVPEVDAPAEQDMTAPSPASSAEGVVAAYNVGDASYAMFADGRIRVSAPEGQFMLGSMEELKRFMAARRNDG
ncbi:MAG: hypothetical protein ACRCUE_01685 [Bosea sp. (in: a-proteobacteria)]